MKEKTKRTIDTYRQSIEGVSPKEIPHGRLDKFLSKIPSPIWGIILGILVFNLLFFFLYIVEVLLVWGAIHSYLINALWGALLSPGLLIDLLEDKPIPYFFIPLPHEWIRGYLVSSIPFAFIGLLFGVSKNSPKTLRTFSIFLALAIIGVYLFLVYFFMLAQAT